MSIRDGFWKNTAGNTAIMMGLAIVPIVIAAGAAIDFSRANYARTVLQGAADAAALAGATSKDRSNSALNRVVAQYLEANHAKDVLRYVSKVEQTLDNDKGTFRVIIEGQIDTSLMSIAGLKKMDIGAVSQVNVGSEALEIALVLDNTGSMAGAKIANLKAAATKLVDILEEETSDYADAKIAVVPFAEYVNVGRGNSGAGWLDTSGVDLATWGGCVGSRPAPLDLQSGTSVQNYPAIEGVPCNAQVLPLTTNLKDVRNRIGAMTATGMTYVPTGLLWGWNVLDSQAPFTEGRTMAEIKRTRGRKALILMTDGENTISPAYPLHNGGNIVASNNNLREMCKKVKDDGIEMYTVSFMVPSNLIKSILVNCATSKTKYFDADNSVQLNAAFTDIARDLAAVRLTQ